MYPNEINLQFIGKGKYLHIKITDEDDWEVMNFSIDQFKQIFNFVKKEKPEWLENDNKN